MKELEDMRNDELFTIVVAGIQILRDNDRKKGYAEGYADGKADTPFTDTEEAEKRAYEKGLNESWECARKMCCMKPEERLLAFDVSGNHLAILSDLTAPKAIEKLKAFEQKQKCKQTKDAEIKVGDEVYSDDFDDNGIVSHITEDGNCVAIISSGSSMMKVNIHNLYKTGRHFPQIAEVLKQMNPVRTERRR